jgi:cell division protein FtsQ
MWDKPDALNTIANLLFATALLLAAYAALHWVVRLPLFPLREVQFRGTLMHVTPEQIEAIVRREVKGTFFTLDLSATRAGFETLPWVRRADARRSWPDRIEVTIEEHVPLARWGSTALVNINGEIFTAAYDGTLPMFMGPETSAKEIAIQYGYFQRSLAAIGQAPVQVQVSQRRAWQLRLDSGLIGELGRDRVEPRLDSFIKVYKRTVARLPQKIDYVDLRYSNGFAVRMPEHRTAPRDKQVGKIKRG